MPEYEKSPAGSVLASFIDFCTFSSYMTYEDLISFNYQQKHERAYAYIFATYLIALARRVFCKSAQSFASDYIALLQQIQQNREHIEPVKQAAANFMFSVNRSAKVGVFGTSFTSLQAITAAFNASPSLELQVNLALAGALEKDFKEKLEQFRAVSSDFFLVPEGVLVTKSDVILTGAECIFKNGALCRPGSLYLAICSNYFKKPFIIIAEASKMCDYSVCSQSEAMRKYYQMVSTRTQRLDYFKPCIESEHYCLVDSYDFVDFELISKVVTDVGVMSGPECQDYICQLFLKQ